MKKTLLAIGSIVTVAAPIAAVVSCGSKTTPKAHTQTTAQTDQAGLDAAKKIALKTWLHAAYPAIQTADLGEVTIQEGFDVSETSHADYAISFAFNKDVNGLAIGGNTENVKDGSSLTFAAFKNKDIKLILDVEGTKKEIAVSDSIKASVIQAAEHQGFTFDAVQVKEEVKPEHIQVAETLGFTVGKETETISWNDATPSKVEGAGHFAVPTHQVVATPFVGFGSTPAVDHKVPSKVEGAGHFAVPHKAIPTSEETVQPQAYQLEITDTATPTELAIESAKARAAADAIIASEHARIENMATIAQRAADEAKQREEVVFELTHPQTDALLNDKGAATAPTPIGHITGDVMPVLQWHADKDLALITELTTGRWKVDFDLQARNEEYTAEELGLINVPTLSRGVTAHYFIEAITGNKDVHVRVELHKEGQHHVIKNLDLQFGGRATVEASQDGVTPPLKEVAAPVVLTPQAATEQSAPRILFPNADKAKDEYGHIVAPSLIDGNGAAMPHIAWHSDADLALITELTTGRWKVDFDLQARNEEYTAEELGLINVPTLSRGVTAHYFIEAITGNKDVHIRVELHKHGEHHVIKNLDLQFGGRISSVETDILEVPEAKKEEVVIKQTLKPTAAESTPARAQTGFWISEGMGVTNAQFTPTISTEINTQIDREETARIFAQVKAEAEAQVIADANAEVWGMAAASLEVAAPILDLTPATPVHVPQPATTNQDVMDLIKSHVSDDLMKSVAQTQEIDRLSSMDAHSIYTLEKK